MRVCLVSQAYPPETGGGGISTQTHAKAHGLASLGHEVHVISHSTDAERHKYWDEQVRVTRIPGFDAGLTIQTEPVRWLTYSTQVAVEVASLNAEHPLDVVDFPEYGAEGYVHSLNQVEWGHIPTVVHLHGPLVMLAHTVGWPEVDSDLYRVGTEMEGACVRKADAVFSSSACSADWCARYYGLEAGDVPIIHTGVDTELFRPLDVPKDEGPTVVFVGKLVANKGVGDLVNACTRLAGEFPGLRVRMIAGRDDAAENWLREQADGAGCAGLLEFAGFVDQAELPMHLLRAHVFAAPSHYEGGPGFVYLEAMGCGLPVVACSGSGASEAVLHGETGLLVPPGDTDALAGALRQLLADVAAREAMGRRGREHVVRHASRPKCLRRLEAFYVELTNRSHPQAR